MKAFNWAISLAFLMDLLGFIKLYTNEPFVALSAFTYAGMILASILVGNYYIATCTWSSK